MMYSILRHAAWKFSQHSRAQPCNVAHGSLSYSTSNTYIHIYDLKRGELLYDISDSYTTNIILLYIMINYIILEASEINKSSEHN